MAIARVTELHIPWWAVLIGAVILLALMLCVVIGGTYPEEPTPDGYRDRTETLL